MLPLQTLDRTVFLHKPNHFDSKDLKEQPIKRIAFDTLEKRNISINNLNALNLAANFLDQAAANDALNSTHYYVPNESSLMPQSRRHQPFMPKDKQRKRKLKVER